MGFLNTSFKLWSILLITCGMLSLGGTEANSSSHYFLLTVAEDSIEISAHNRDGSLAKDYEGLVSMKTVPPIKTMAGKIYFSKYDEGIKYFIKPPVVTATQVIMLDSNGSYGQALMMPPPVEKINQHLELPQRKKKEPMALDPKEPLVIVEEISVIEKFPPELEEPVIIPLERPSPDKPEILVPVEVGEEKEVIKRIPRPTSVTEESSEETAPARLPIRKPVEEKPEEEKSKLLSVENFLALKLSPEKLTEEPEETTEESIEEAVEKKVNTETEEPPSEEDELEVNEKSSKEVVEVKTFEEEETILLLEEENKEIEDDDSWIEISIKFLFIILMSYFLFSYGRFLNTFKNKKI